MTEIITYSLRAGQTNSDGYYQRVAEFADEALAHLEREYGALLADFCVWCRQSPGNSQRSPAVASLEFLSLGVYWNLYRVHARVSSRTWLKLSTWLYGLRKHSPMFKAVSDWLRGVLGGLLRPRLRPDLTPGGDLLAEFRLLVCYMASTGEFSEEIQRLSVWREHLLAAPEKAAVVIQSAREAADWFAVRSLEQLGEFSANVEGYLRGEQSRHRWQEDDFFTGRQRLEYHLNMVASEVLNRELRPEFVKTGQRILIVPPCMKARSDEECKAVETPFGARCAACTPACRVNQVTKLGERFKFKVFIIPDDLEKFSGGAGVESQVGLVGVSCPLTNASGGWQMHRLGVPAQGVLLDYCGCVYHWHKDGIPTDVNFKQILKVMGD